MTRPAARPVFHGNVVALPVTETLPRFTSSDRAVLFDEAVKLHDGLGLVACLYEEKEVGEFGTISVQGSCSASWCVARQKDGLLLWNAQTGADVGRYRLMGEVLACVEALSVGAEAVYVKLFGVAESLPASTVICLQSVRARRSEQGKAAPDAQKQALLTRAV